jgi:aminoglycoside phosphotransferase (APT) family kinase protein
VLSTEHVFTYEEETDVFRLEMSSGDVFFKSEERYRIVEEAWAYRTAAGAGVPVPDVLHVDDSCERWPKPFSIITALTGSSIAKDPLEGAALADALAHYGAMLRLLHAVELPGFGAFVELGRGKHPTLADATRTLPNWGLPYLHEHGLLDDATVANVRHVVERHEELYSFRGPAVFIHGDPGFDHVFADRITMKITGLIDFEPRAADPAMDLGIFAFHYPLKLEYLLAGYGPVPDDMAVRVDFHAMLRGVGASRWMHEKGLRIDDHLPEVTHRAARLSKMLG